HRHPPLTPPSRGRGIRPLAPRSDVSGKCGNSCGLKRSDLQFFGEMLFCGTRVPIGVSGMLLVPDPQLVLSAVRGISKPSPGGHAWSSCGCEIPRLLTLLFVASLSSASTPVSRRKCAVAIITKSRVTCVVDLVVAPNVAISCSALWV